MAPLAYYLYKPGCHFNFYGELFDPFTQLLGEKKLARFKMNIEFFGYYTIVFGAYMVKCEILLSEFGSYW
jgi:hypothetical protein